MNELEGEILGWQAGEDRRQGRLRHWAAPLTLEALDVAKLPVRNLGQRGD